MAARQFPADPVHGPLHEPLTPLGGCPSTLVPGALRNQDDDLTLPVPTCTPSPLYGSYLAGHRLIEYDQIGTGDVQTLLPDGGRYQDVGPTRPELVEPSDLLLGSKSATAISAGLPNELNRTNPLQLTEGLIDGGDGVSERGEHDDARAGVSAKPLRDQPAHRAHFAVNLFHLRQARSQARHPPVPQEVTRRLVLGLLASGEALEELP